LSINSCGEELDGGLLNVFGGVGLGFDMLWV